MPSTSGFTTPFITFIPAGVAPICVLPDSNEPDPNQRSASDPNYPAFQDAMTVREEVFVMEQGVPLENELDEDDYRSFHWVVYASVASALGTIRLVPPPHAPHTQVTPTPHHHPDSPPPGANEEGNYIKLGRLATIPAFRGLGIGKLLVETALNWAAEHPEEIMGDIKSNKRLSVSGVSITEQMRKASVVKGDISVTANAARVGDLGALMFANTRGWEGKVLVHSQKQVKGMWEKFGFVYDPRMGEWDEEGIIHVGLWKQLQIKKPA
ncbi:acyl-CoA N-acyltransferase [Terfezia claveryi]|nr:acyl-CoA N-acyltransferase [Terfezia claveryi]